METLKLKAEIREKVGGLSSKQLIYKEGRIPGIIYGGKNDPQPIFVQQNELLKIISNEGLFNSIVEIELNDKKEKVVFKELSIIFSCSRYILFYIRLFFFKLF